MTEQLSPDDPRSAAYRAPLPVDARPSGGAPYWSPGTQILWRYGHRSIRPMTVVRDNADGLVAWLAPGTRVLRPVLEDGSELRSRPSEQFSLPRAVMADGLKGDGILKFAPTGTPWSIWLFRDRSWYVNLEDVHVREGHNLYTRDRVLDLVVDPDRSVRLKDVDELELAVKSGRNTRPEADSYHADARTIRELIAGWDSPFCDGWESWRPDPLWPIPELPKDIRPDFVG